MPLRALTPHDLWYTTGTVASLCSISRPEVRRWEKWGLVTNHMPHSLHRRYHRGDLIRFFLRWRMAHYLRAFAWQPSSLLVGCAPSLCTEVQEKTGKLRVRFASDIFTAGVFLARFEPVSIALDFSLSRTLVLGILGRLRQSRPWLRLIGLVCEDENGLVENLCDYVLPSPQDPSDVAAAILEGGEASDWQEEL